MIKFVNIYDENWLLDKWFELLKVILVPKRWIKCLQDFTGLAGQIVVTMEKTHKTKYNCFVHFLRSQVMIWYHMDVIQCGMPISRAVLNEIKS